MTNLSTLLLTQKIPTPKPPPQREGALRVANTVTLREGALRVANTVTLREGGLKSQAPSARILSFGEWVFKVANQISLSYFDFLANFKYGNILFVLKVVYLSGFTNGFMISAKMVFYEA
ncbi:hypothetical protein [Helicobacter macacae]|nr:hypothetical protein [Helicobacter macacae]